MSEYTKTLNVHVTPLSYHKGYFSLRQNLDAVLQELTGPTRITVRYVRSDSRAFTIRFQKQRTRIQADGEILVKQMAIGFEKPRKQDEDKSLCYYCS